MSAATTGTIDTSDGGLDALARAALALEPVPAHLRKGLLREECAELVDGLLAPVARGRGALDVSLGECLAELAVGDRALRLGYSGIGDYARERLGVAARTAQSMARLARELRSRPLLHAAVRSGEVSARKASAVLPVARGEDEARWVERARHETVRQLEAAIQAEAAGRRADDDAGDEPWERIAIPISPDARAKLDQALELAGAIIGRTTPRWLRLEVVLQEYLGAHPLPDDVDASVDAGLVRGPLSEWLEPWRAVLEEETAHWAALAVVPPVAAPPVEDRCGDAWKLDAELRRLAAMRDRWDELVGHLGLLVKSLGLWRELGFSDLGHYASERLGISARALEQRAALARRLYALPALGQALRSGRVSYEKARIVAGVAQAHTVEVWIDRAERTTCVALRAAADAVADTQMRAARELHLRLPERVGALLDEALRAVRATEERFLTSSECLARIADHFVETWATAAAERNTLRRRVLERDGWRCQAPGCSRAAVHAHHVEFRSRGGGDDLWNLTSLCGAHHLQCVHRGFLRVTGRAPEALRWELTAPSGPAAAAA